MVQAERMARHRALDNLINERDMEHVLTQTNMTFLIERLYQVVEQEAGLPRCDELKFSVSEDFMSREYLLGVMFPDNYMLVTRIPYTTIAQTNLDAQIDLVCDAVRKSARQWILMHQRHDAATANQ